MAIPEEEDVLPWKETSVESERLQFIERHAAGEETVAEPEVWYQSQDWLQADWSV